MLSATIDLLDGFYSHALGAQPTDFRRPELTVAQTPTVTAIRFARSWPLALFSMARPKGGTVLAVRPPFGKQARAALIGAAELDEAAQEAVRNALQGALRGLWFQGVRLCCDRSCFVNRTEGEVRQVEADDERAGELHGIWGGPVFGRIVDGVAVSLAAVKPLSDVVWDLRVETLPDYRGRGFARSAVSAAVDYILSHNVIAGWGTDTCNTGSVRTAVGVGFSRYAGEFGCIECAD